MGRIDPLTFPASFTSWKTSFWKRNYNIYIILKLTTTAFCWRLKRPELNEAITLYSTFFYIEYIHNHLATKRRITMYIILDYLGVTLKSESQLPKKKVFYLFQQKPFKMMKNAFYFMLKALLLLKIFTFLFWLFVYVEKRLDKKPRVNFKVYDVTDWITSNYNTRIVQYLKK